MNDTIKTLLIAAGIVAATVIPSPVFEKAPVDAGVIAEVSVLPDEARLYPDIQKDRLREYLQTVRPMNPDMVSVIPPNTSDIDILQFYRAAKEFEGGIWFHNDRFGVPPCDESTRGLMWFSPAEKGYADQVLFCLKKADESYQWSAFQI